MIRYFVTYVLFVAGLLATRGTNSTGGFVRRGELYRVKRPGPGDPRKHRVFVIVKQGDLMRKSGNLISEILDDDLQTTDTETTIEINFAVLKLQHLIKKIPKKS